MPKGFGGSRRQLHVSMAVAARSCCSNERLNTQPDMDRVQENEDTTPTPAKTLRMWIDERRKAKAETPELAPA